MSATQATGHDRPRARRSAVPDHAFRLAAGSAAIFVLAVLVATAAAMFAGGLPAFRAFGLLSFMARPGTRSKSSSPRGSRSMEPWLHR